MEIKIRYTYGIPGKPETYFSRVFTIEQIENNDHFYPEHEIIARDLCAGFTDKNGVAVFNNDNADSVYGIGKVFYENGRFKFDFNLDADDLFSVCSGKELESFVVIGNKHTEDK